MSDTTQTLRLESIEAGIVLATQTDGEAKSIPSADILAYSGQTMNVAGSALPLVIDLSEPIGTHGKLKLLRDHDKRRPLGSVERIEQTATEVRAFALLNGPASNSREVIDSAADGFEWSVSVGYEPGSIEELKRGQKRTINGREITGPANIAKGGKWVEISLLAIGADSTASARIAAEQADTTEPEQQVEQADDGGKAAIEASIRESELQRIEQIHALCTPAKAAGLAKQAIQAGWSPTRVQTELDRINSSVGTGVGVSILGADRMSSEQMILNARGLLNAGFSEQQIADKYHGDVIRAAHRAGPITARDLLETSLEARGVSTRGMSVHSMIEASVGSHPLGSTDALLNELLSYTTREPGALLETSLCAPKTANDFRPRKSFVLDTATSIGEIGTSGVLDQGQLTELEGNGQAASFGASFKLTRKQMLDSGEITLTMPKLFVRKLRNVKNRLVAAKINSANSSGWLATGVGYFTGAATALGVDSLAVGVRRHRERLDSSGDPIDQLPSVLVVPSSLESMARDLVQNMGLIVNGVGDSASVRPNAISVAQTLTVVSSAWLGSNHGGSDTAWYLLTSPSQVEALLAISVGSSSPIIRSHGWVAGLDGWQWDVVQDFGVGLGDSSGITGFSGVAE